MRARDAARRHGDHIVVGSIRAEVFDARTGAPVSPEERPTHPEDKGLWTVREEGERYVLVKMDAVSLAVVKKVPLPATPATPTLVWLGRERWLVHLTDTPGAILAALTGNRFVVDAETGSVTPIEASAGCATLDGVHFALPIGAGNAWRRFRIYGEDLTAPVRTLASGQRFSHLGVLADGERVLAWNQHELAYWDRDGHFHGPFEVHGASVRDVCPSRSGDHVITWDFGGVVRLWSLM